MTSTAPPVGVGFKTLSAINTAQQMITLYPGFEEVTFMPFIVGIAPADIGVAGVAVHGFWLFIR